MKEPWRTVGILLVVVLVGALVVGSVDPDSALIGVGRVMIAAGLIGLGLVAFGRLAPSREH